MSNKQISKDNREYWQRKLSKKFDEKKSVIQSLHQLEINETSKKNYPIFVKRLGILKDLENIKKSQKEFNDYSLNFQKRLEEKRKKLKIHYDILREKLEDWQPTRDWSVDSYDYPKYHDDSNNYHFDREFENFLKTCCKDETKKAFYNSKKGQELKKLDELEEKATDLLHSDMIGAEVLKQISLIAKQTQINMTIPSETVKALPNG